MSALNFTFGDGGFPTNFTGDPQDFFDTMVANLTATISSDRLLFGQIGGTQPLSNIGLWVDGTTLKVWDSVGLTYVPITLQILNSGHILSFTSETLTGDRELTFQDQTGKIATLSDIYDTRGTTVVVVGTPVIDWSVSSAFFCSLTATTTFTFSNSLPGQEIVLVLSATGAFTAAFPPEVLWKGGTQAAQTASKPDMYFFHNIGGTIYGYQLQNFS